MVSINDTCTLWVVFVATHERQERLYYGIGKQGGKREREREREKDESATMPRMK